MKNGSRGHRFVRNLTWNTGTPKLVEKQKDGTTITATYDSKRVVSTTQPAAK